MAESGESLPATYDAERTTGTEEPNSWQRLRASRSLRTFRGVCIVLGIELCLVGTLHAAVAVFLVKELATASGFSWKMYAAGGALTAFSVAVVGVYFALAVGSFRRRVWAAWGALTIDSLLLATSCSFGEFNAVSFVISLVVVVTALAVLYFARLLKAAGIPLQAKL